MNPLSELKERLVNITIAGTELIDEDFRLKKTLELFSTLAEKNPIFKKIYLSLKQLFDAEKSQKPIILLNILGLVDAVLYTQAQTEIDGEYKELETKENLQILNQFRYSEVKPVLEALTTTGSGRLNVLEDAVKLTPNIFSDYRVLNALINDLDDTYGEMAMRVFNIIESMGTGRPQKFINFTSYPQNYRSLIFDKYYLPKVDKDYIISLLKSNFDPQGKKIMAKRLRLIAKISKETENDWYLSILKTAKREVKEECISALQYSEENIPLLLELIKKERGKTKDMVYSTLGKFKFDNMVEFWKNELDKSIENASNLKEANSDEISDLLAHYIKSNLENVLKGDEQAKKYDYSKLISYTANKTSDKMLELYKWIIDYRNEFKALNLLDQNKSNQYSQYIIVLNETISETLVSSCPEKLVDFLRKLNVYHKKPIITSCFIADLLTLPANEIYENWYQNPLLTKAKLEKVFQQIKYIDNAHYVTLTPYYYDSYNRAYQYESNQIQREIKEPLDKRWFDYIIELKLHELLYNLTPTGNYEICEKIGEYFYNQLLNLELKKNVIPSRTISEYLYMMKHCSYNKFEGVILNICKKCPQISAWDLRIILYTFRDYTDAKTTSEETKKILEFYEKNYGQKKRLYIENLLTNEGFIQEGI